MMTVKKKAVTKELLDDLLADYRKPEDLIGENEAVENPAGNTRNGKSRKTLKGEFGELPIEILRDRHGTFEPQLIPKKRGAAQTLLFGAQKHQQEMDDADSGLEGGLKPLYYRVR
jgi:transposase-like protein